MNNMISWQNVTTLNIDEYSGYLGLEKIATMKLHKRYAQDCDVFRGQFVNIVDAEKRYYAPSIEILQIKMEEALLTKLQRMDLIHHRPELENE